MEERILRNIKIDEPYDSVASEVEIECPDDLMETSIKCGTQEDGEFILRKGYSTANTNSFSSISSSKNSASITCNTGGDRRKQEIVVRSVTLDDSSSHLHDSGISLLSDSSSSTSERRTPCSNITASSYFNRNDVILFTDQFYDVQTPSIATPDSGCANTGLALDKERAERAAFRAEQRARLGRELDKCYLREVRTDQRTPSPNCRMLTSTVAENFNVSWYYRGEGATSDKQKAAEGSSSANVQAAVLDSVDNATRCSIRRTLQESSFGKLGRSISCTESARRGSEDLQQALRSVAGETVTGVAQSHRPLYMHSSLSSSDHRKRPPHSYLNLIQMALCSRPDLKMTLREIYGWIEKSFPYYKHIANQGWKNSIRHNLSLYDIFVREKPNGSSNKSTGCSYWTLRSDATQLNLDQTSNNSVVERSSDAESNDSRSKSDSGKRPSVSQKLLPKKALVPLLPKPSGYVTQSIGSHQAVGPHLLNSQPHFVSSTFVSTAPCGIFSSIASTGSGIAQLLTASQAIADPPRGTFLSKRHSAFQCTTPKKRSRAFEGLTSTRTRSRVTILPKRQASLDPSALNTAVLSPETEGSLNLSPTSSPICLADVLPVASSPFNSSNESLTLSRSLNTSQLRQQLSDINFDSKSSIELQLLNESVSSSQGLHATQFKTESQGKASTCESNPSVAGRSRRRKQEFKLLRSPSEAKKKSATDEFDGSTCSTQTSRDLSDVSAISYKDTSSSFEPLHGSPPRTPENATSQDDDESLMLLTPFRSAALLESPSLWLSPIRDFGRMTPGLPFTPGDGHWLPEDVLLSTPGTHEGTRTSTPCGQPLTGDLMSTGRRSRRRSESPRVSSFRIPDDTDQAMFRSSSDRNINSTGGYPQYESAESAEAWKKEASGYSNYAFKAETLWKNDNEASNARTGNIYSLSSGMPARSSDTTNSVATDSEALTTLCSSLADTSPSLLNKALLQCDRSPPDISFILQSPVFRRILGEDSSDGCMNSSISRVLNFSPLH